MFTRQYIEHRDVNGMGSMYGFETIYIQNHKENSKIIFKQQTS